MMPQGLTLFLVEGMAEGQDDAPGPFTSVPKNFPQQLSKAPSTTQPIQEEPGIKSHPGHLLVNAGPIPDQSQRDEILIVTPAGGAPPAFS